MSKSKVYAKDTWYPIDTVPMNGQPVLVYLEEAMLGSRIQAASFLKHIGTIGSLFAFDAPKATHWRYPPDGPDA